MPEDVRNSLEWGDARLSRRPDWRVPETTADATHIVIPLVPFVRGKQATYTSNATITDAQGRVVVRYRERKP